MGCKLLPPAVPQRRRSLAADRTNRWPSRAQECISIWARKYSPDLPKETATSDQDKISGRLQLSPLSNDTLKVLIQVKQEAPAVLMNRRMLSRPAVLTLAPRNSRVLPGSAKTLLNSASADSAKPGKRKQLHLRQASSILNPLCTGDAFACVSLLREIAAISLGRRLSVEPFAPSSADKRGWRTLQR